LLLPVWLDLNICKGCVFFFCMAVFPAINFQWKTGSFSGV
jgi:hypothetical protein